MGGEHADRAGPARRSASTRRLARRARAGARAVESGSRSSVASCTSTIADGALSRAARFDRTSSLGARRSAARRVPSTAQRATARRRCREPHEAARRAERLTRLFHGRAGERLEVELGAQRGARSWRAAARARAPRRARSRTRSLERDRRLRGERLHHREVLVRERPVVVRRRDGDHRDHPAVADQRDEAALFAPTSAASRGLTRVEPLDVVDREAATPRRRRSRCPTARASRSTRTSGHQATSLPFARPRKPDASRPSSETKASDHEADAEERARSRRAAPARRPRRRTSARAPPRSGAGSRAPGPARRRGRLHGHAPPGLQERADEEPDARARPRTTSDALPREREAVQAEGDRRDCGHTGRRRVYGGARASRPSVSG